MFKAVKMKNIGLTVFSLVCLSLFVGVCALMLRAGAPDTVAIGTENYSLIAEDDADISAFLDVCGYQAGDMISKKDITVPKHWNDLYSSYNELQRSQGFDLAPYKGKPAQELVFSCSDSEECITLIIGDGKIIAAHICPEDGSGMRPLIKNGE